jgi:hypothetical protein
MEELIRNDGKSFPDFDLETLEKYWQRAKDESAS